MHLDKDDFTPSETKIYTILLNISKRLNDINGKLDRIADQIRDIYGKYPLG